MKGFTLTEHFGQSPKEIFSVISDPTQAVHYVDGIALSEKLTVGPTSVGSVFRETRVVKGKPTSADLRVTGHEENSHFAIASEAEGIAVTYHYRLTPEGEGTRVDWTCELEAGGLRRVMLPLVLTIMKREDGDHLDKLKTYLASKPATGEVS